MGRMFDTPALARWIAGLMSRGREAEIHGCLECVQWLTQLFPSIRHYHSCENWLDPLLSTGLFENHAESVVHGQCLALNQQPSSTAKRSYDYHLTEAIQKLRHE